ncbi:tRNA-splicing endonuclease subunit sen54 N-term-domain-containing protein [Dissophora ornata]|nr:tRNA-splicing endonuclease subunit sen54 N-term-domain-containing protein [Dissophora ornata]
MQMESNNRVKTMLDIVSNHRPQHLKHARRTFSRAVYHPELGLFRLTVNKGTHFVSMGHTIRGQIYLYPEEALYLVDRGSLLVDHHGIDMSVQQMWSLYLSEARVSGQPQSRQAAQESTAEPSDSLAMEKYLTYAYLKRLGFIVIRSGTYRHEVDARLQHTPTPRSQVLAQLFSGATFWWSTLWRSLFAAWRNRTTTLVADVGLRLGAATDIWTRKSSRPLVANNAQLHYDQILQTLRIIPAVRLARNPQDCQGAPAEKKEYKKNRHVVDFDVYKPAGAFKKRQPGIPDYRVVVVSVDAALPALNELRVLMEEQLDPAQEIESSTAAPEKGKKKLAPNWPGILFAVVDGGQVSFINIFNIKAVPQML